MLSAHLPSMAAMPETRRLQKVLEKRFNRDPQLFDHITACEDTLWVFLFRVSFLTLFFLTLYYYLEGCTTWGHTITFQPKIYGSLLAGKFRFLEGGPPPF